MKQNVHLALVVAALALAGCANPALNNSDLANKQGVIQAASAGNQIFLTFSAPTGSLTNATGQTITITFSAPVTLSGTTVPGITLYPVSNAASATASYVRGTAISYTAVQNTTVPGGSSTVTLTADLTSATGLLEVVMSAATLTGSDTGLKLDTNGSLTSGESTDDSVTYLSVGGATAPTTGVQENPQATVQISAPGGSFLAGGLGTTLTYTVTDSATGNNVDATNIFSSSNFILQQFDYANKVWNDVSYTVSGTVPNITLTPANASVAGAWYRTVIKDRSKIVETTATNGYLHARSYSAAKMSVGGATAVGGASYAVGGVTYQLFSASSATATFNGNLKEGYVTVVFTGLGTAGLDAASVTHDNVRIAYSAVTGSQTLAAGVQWLSSEILTTTTKNDTLRLYLAPNYARQNSAATLRIFGLTGNSLKAADLTNLTDLTQAITITGNL